MDSSGSRGCWFGARSQGRPPILLYATRVRTHHPCPTEATEPGRSSSSGGLSHGLWSISAGGRRNKWRYLSSGTGLQADQSVDSVFSCWGWQWSPQPFLQNHTDSLCGCNLYIKLLLKAAGVALRACPARPDILRSWHFLLRVYLPWHFWAVSERMSVAVTRDEKDGRGVASWSKNQPKIASSFSEFWKWSTHIYFCLQNS